MSKIGIGIITCNRSKYLKRLLDSLHQTQESKFDELIIINDGKEITDIDISYVAHINNETNLGVGKSKNKALNYLLKKDCDYIFLLEDDIVIKDLNVFQKYIEASKLSGIQHFNFAFHGNDNYHADGTSAVRLKVEYSKDVAVCFYPNVYGAFSFYTKKCLDAVGLMDEEFYNAMEHVDHTYSIIDAGMHPPFRWFADIANSNMYIEEIDKNHSGSEIRRDEKWISNFKKAVARFAEKSKIDVTSPYQPSWSKEEAIDVIKHIKKIYGSK
jgi:glycosyltransferase involved in cell wall biosynthesis